MGGGCKHLPARIAKISNRVGLAAGFDKNGRVFHSIGKFGFGYVVVGTVTLNAKKGNPKPRFRRLSKYESLINSMGFPNDGAIKIAQRIAINRSKLEGVPIVVSISGTNINEISECLKIVEPCAEALELNLSSPNTKGIKVFHQEDVQLLGYNPLHKHQFSLLVQLNHDYRLHMPEYALVLQYLL